MLLLFLTIVAALLAVFVVLPFVCAVLIETWHDLVEEARRSGLFTNSKGRE
jgi:hypothetical protein